VAATIRRHRCRRPNYTLAQALWDLAGVLATRQRVRQTRDELRRSATGVVVFLRNVSGATNGASEGPLVVECGRRGRTTGLGPVD